MDAEIPDEPLVPLELVDAELLEEQSLYCPFGFQIPNDVSRRKQLLGVRVGNRHAKRLFYRHDEFDAWKSHRCHSCGAALVLQPREIDNGAPMSSR
jgi:hypothetical protein